jgi:hypothetical protein
VCSELVFRQQHQFASVSPQDLAWALIAAPELNTVSLVSTPNDIIFNQKLTIKILKK